MDNNKKLIGQLRLGLNSLQNDINEANKILGKIDVNKLKLGIDSKTARDSINYLKLIEKELENIKKTSGSNGNFDVTNRLVTSLINSISKMGSVTTKVTNQIIKDADGTTLAMKHISEQVDATGKKISTLSNKDAKGATTSVIETTTRDIEKQRKEVEKLSQAEKTAQNQMQSAIVRTEQNRRNRAATEELAQARAINRVLDEQYKNRLRITAEQEKLNMAALKQYTMEQANLKYAAGLLPAKTLNERLNSISGVAKNHTLGSGDARNSTFADRFNVAKDYVVSSKIFNTAFTSIDNAYNAIKNYELGLIDLSRTLNNITNNDLKNFGQQAIQSSKDFGIPLQEVQTAMTELARAGVDNKDNLESMTKSILTGINTTEIKSAADMTGYLISTVKQLGMTYDDTEKIIDSWNLLSDKYAVKSNDFAEATQRAGSASKAFGLDLHTLNAMTVVLGEQTQKSGNEVGNAIKTMETRMLRPETIKTLESLGIEVMKDSKHFNSFQSIMTQVNQKMDEFGENSIQANELMDSLGGAWRKNDIQVLSNGWDQINKITQESMNSSGYSIKENEKAMGTLSKQVEIMKNSFTELFISFGDNGLLVSLKSFVMSISSMAQGVTKLPGSLKELIILFVGVGGALKLLNGGVSLFTGQNLKQHIDALLPRISAFSNAFGDGNAKMRSFSASTQELTRQFTSNNITGKQFAVISSEIATQMGISKSNINTYSIAQKSLKAQLDAGNITQNVYNAKLTELKRSIKGAETQTASYTAAQKALSAANKSAILSSIALNAAMIAVNIGITLAIFGIIKLINSRKEAQKAQEELTQTAKQNIEQNNSIITYLKNEGAAYDELSKKTELTTAEQEKLNSIKEKIAQQFPQLITGYDQETGQVKLQAKSTSELIELIKEKNKLENDRIVAAGKDILVKKQDEYAKKQKEINELMQEADQIKTGGDKVGKSSPFYTHTIDGLTELQEVTGLTAKQQEELNEKTEQYAQKMNSVKVKMSEQKEIVQEFQTTMNAIYSNKEMDSFSQKLANIVINPTKLISNDQIDYTSALVEVQKFKDKIENNPNFKNIKMIIQLDNPKEDDIKNYFNNITELSKMLDIKPLELTKIFPFKADKQVIAKMIDAYIKDLENQLAKANPKDAEVLKDKINILNGMKIQLNVEGVDGIGDATSSVNSLNEAMASLAGQMKTAKSIISNVNDILDKHTKSNEWDMESIVELAQTYPALLTKLGDDKALTEELIKIKNKEKDTVLNALAVKIKAQKDAVNMMIDTGNDNYKIDIENFKTAEEAKLEILGKSLNEKLRLYKQDADNALSVAQNSPDPIVRENAQRGAMRSGALYGMQYAKVNSSIDVYFQLKGASKGINDYFGSVGSDALDGKKSSSSSDSSTIFNASPLNKYDAYIKTINDSLSTTDDKIATITQKISNLQSLESKSNYGEIINQENAKLDEQNKKLAQLSSSKSQAIKVQSQIKDQFYANFSSMRGKDLTTLSESDWTNIYNSMYGKDINFGTGDSAKAREQKYQDGAKLFQDLMKSYQSASELIQQLGNDELKLQQEINSTIKDKINAQLSGYDELLSSQQKVTDTTQNKLDLLNIVDSNNLNEKVRLTEELLSENKTYNKTLETTRDALIQQRDSMLNIPSAWNLLNNAVEDYNDKIVQSNKTIAQQEQDIKSLLEDEISKLIELEKTNSEIKLENEYKSYKNMHDTRIKEIENEITLLEKRNDQENIAEERQKRALELEKLRLLLENTRNQKNIQQLTKNQDGTYQFTYVADQEKIDDLNEQIKEKQEDFTQWEKEQTLKSNRDALEAEKQHEQDLITEKEKYYNAEKEKLDLHYSDMDILVKNYMDSLKITYSDKWDSILLVLQDKLSKAKILNEQLTGLQAQKQNTLDSLYSQALNFKDVDSYKDANPNASNSNTSKNSIIDDIINKALNFDTGGYTGEWGADGKLAFLHQKELVLKSNDTKNLLESVKINNELATVNPLPNIVNTLKLIDFSQFSNLDKQPQQIIYNFKGIEFPNITNESGLQNLLDSFKQLPRLATQYK